MAYSLSHPHFPYFRNIIERSYQNESRNRKAAISSDDEGLLHKFKQAKKNESQLKDKVNINLRQEDIRRLVSGLCFIFIGVISLLVSYFLTPLTNTSYACFHSHSHPCLSLHHPLTYSFPTYMNLPIIISLAHALVCLLTHSLTL